jgi:hypothetical protein
MVARSDHLAVLYHDVFAYCAGLLSDVLDSLINKKSNVVPWVLVVVPVRVAAH